MLNVDQEDPPERDPAADRRARVRRRGHRLLACDAARGTATGRRLTSPAFNWVLNKATGYDVPLNVGTLRVMKRPAVDRAQRPARSASRYIPGLEMWLGFRHGLRRDRPSSRAQRGPLQLLAPGRRLRMAFEAIISFSDLPLRFVVLLGAHRLRVGFVLAAVPRHRQATSSPTTSRGTRRRVAAIVFVGGDPDRRDRAGQPLHRPDPRPRSSTAPSTWCATPTSSDARRVPRNLKGRRSRDAVDGQRSRYAIDNDGYVIIEGRTRSRIRGRGKAALLEAIDREAEYHGGTDYSDYGMVLLCALYGGSSSISSTTSGSSSRSRPTMGPGLHRLRLHELLDAARAAPTTRTASTSTARG